MTTEEELTRENNERAKALLNNNSYESFKQIKENNNLEKDYQEETKEIKRSDVAIENRENFVNQNIENKNYQEIPQKIEVEEKAEPVKYASYGGFWVRLAASILTSFFGMVIVGIGSGLIFVSLGGPDKYMQAGNQINPLLFLLGIIPVVLYYIYNIYLYFKYGQSVGYKILGLKIISEDTGEKPNSWTLLGRFGVKFLLTYLPYINLIGYLVIGGMIAWTEKKQGPHDKAAGTVVVSTKNTKTWIIILSVLLVFSIIPITASILYRAIDSAKYAAAANDVRTQAIVIKTRTDSDLYFANTNSYNGFCNSIHQNNLICEDDDTNFVVAGELTSEKYFCADAKGFTGEVQKVNLENRSCE